MKSAILLGSVLAVTALTQPAQCFSETVALNPKDLAVPKQCPESFTYDATGSACVKAGVANVEPQCYPLNSYTAKKVGVGANASCVYERETLAVSHAGDYVGDCFRISAAVTAAGAGAGTSLAPGKNYMVTAQDQTNPNNPDLTLVKAKNWDNWPRFQEYVPVLGCTPEEGGSTMQVKANDMVASGARRRGFSYGILTMPYKYFVSERSFVSGLPLGGYLGWRVGQPGAGGTFAIATTLSSVKADVLDPQNASVTGTTDVMALSAAAGFIFDVTRSPAGKSFKSGIFFGKDYVNSDATIRYKFNRKTWIAVQFGFDFTDN